MSDSERESFCLFSSLNLWLLIKKVTKRNLSTTNLYQVKLFINTLHMR